MRGVIVIVGSELCIKLAKVDVAENSILDVRRLRKTLKPLFASVNAMIRLLASIGCSARM